MESKVNSENYKRIKLLGDGSFGKAYMCEDIRSKEKVVVKEIDLKGMSEKEKKETFKEARILSALQHPNIILFKEVYMTKNSKLKIVMDFAEGFTV